MRPSNADAAKYGVPAVMHGDVVNQLLNDNGLADTRSAKESCLSPFRIGLQKIDYFDSGLKHLLLR